jgi:polyisoprenoid-binding protein YceI
MKRATTLAAAAVLLMAALLSAQAPPNFAGKWTLVPDPNAPAGGGRGMAMSPAVTVVQDASTLTMTRTSPMGEFTSTYKLDGSDSKNTLNFNGNAIEQLSKAKWDGGTLIVNTTMNFDGNAVEMSTVMSLDAAGNLNIESTRPDFQGGGAPVTTKATYKKN